MTNYNTFAKFYDTAMGDMTPKINLLKGLVEKYNPTAKNVFEMACGTGTVLLGFSDTYEVAGLDLSPGMIEVAKQKMPNADLRVEDMTDFDFGGAFDAVLCVYDSINHLSKWKQWTAVFEKAKEHLNPNGLFIFDFNPEKRLEYLVSMPAQVSVLGDDYMITKIIKSEEGYDFDQKVFEKKEDNIFELKQENIFETSFPLEQIKNEVLKNFDILEIVNNKGLPEDHANWRPFFVCKKK